MPSLRGLGSNDPKQQASSSKCAICGFPVREGVQECGACSIIRATSSSVASDEENVRVVPPQIAERRRANKRNLLIAGSVGGVVLAGVGLFFGVSYLLQFSGSGKTHLSGEERFSEFVRKTDDFIPGQAFGNVNIIGKNAEVTLQETFFTALGPNEERQNIVSIRNYWFDSCQGKEIKFVRANGTVADQYTK